MDPKGKNQSAAETASTPALTKIIASSLAPAPGHWRAKHFWPTGEPAVAELTEKQVAAVRADRRIRVMNDLIRPDAAIPTTTEFVQKRQDAIRAEMDKMVEDGIRAKAVERVRARGTMTAAEETRNAPGWKDRKSGSR